MKSSDRKRFAELLHGVYAYYEKTCSNFTLDAYWGALEKFEFEEIQRLMNRHIRNPDGGQFSPRIADLVKLLEGTAVDRAAIAWGKTLEAMAGIGSYRDVIFDDPVIHAVVDDMGGWPKLCRTEKKELGPVQHRFCISYAAYAKRESFPFPKRLSGDQSSDSEFEKIGVTPPKPVMIGDPERCAAVFSGGEIGGKTKFTSISHTALLALGAPK